ncbi:MAG: YgdI/YgdR family lipoprotein [Cohaesibacter sp.]|jgi:hypothetical protein|nr:YgdI/YgdR family lipoprotein [Cohaesibacter sp.]
MGSKTSIAVLAISGALVLSGCSTSKVVQTEEIGDNNLTCEQIKFEIAEAKRFENEAQGKKGITGTNVAAAALFWPALIVTYSSAEEAENAARTRQANLVRIANQKQCPAD